MTPNVITIILSGALVASMMEMLYESWVPTRQNAIMVQSLTEKFAHELSIANQLSAQSMRESPAMTTSYVTNICFKWQITET